MVKNFFITNSKNMVNQIKLISLLLMTSVLFGCANNEETAEEAYINDVVRAYETAQTAVVAANYRRAIGLFTSTRFGDGRTMIYAITDLGNNAHICNA